MLNSWALVIGLVGLVAALLISVARSKKAQDRRAKTQFKAFANTADIRDLPEYKSAKKKYRLCLIATVTLLFVSVMSASVLSARPASVTVAKPNYENRDIMFCLDVSGSMNEYIIDLLRYYSTAMNKLQGQRIGLTIFDGVYMTIAPLSDDYEMLSEVFKDLADRSSDYWFAIANGSSSSSEIGPGLVGCVDAFDKLEKEDRSRAIILATDNYASPTQAISLTEAANYAKRYDIAVYGLSTSDSRSQSEIDNLEDGTYESSINKEYREAMLSTGGAYYSFSKYSDEEVAVKQIIERIMEQAAARHEGADTLVYKDSPLIPTIIVIISLGAFFAIVWRLGL